MQAMRNEIVRLTSDHRGAVSTHDQDIAALRDVLVPFLRLDYDIGDEWTDVCEAARHVHEATGA
jgi:hypothetical protein